MGDSTGIQWTDRTWSPWEGCTKVSPGCDRCYAASMNRWLQKGAKATIKARCEDERAPSGAAKEPT